jgi:phosphoglycolate phosphatase
MHEKFNASAVIFDLDGTLVDTAPDLTLALNHVLLKAGREVVANAAVRNMVGHGARALIVKGLADTGGVLPEAEIDIMFEDFIEFYGENIAVQSRPFPGAVDYLLRLADAGIKLGLCTNKRQDLTEALTEALDLTRHFQVIAGGDRFPERKPDPLHVTGTLELLGAAADETLFIGDSETDLKAARAAGVPIALVTFGYSRDPVESLAPDALIESFEGL